MCRRRGYRGSGYRLSLGGYRGSVPRGNLRVSVSVEGVSVAGVLEADARRAFLENGTVIGLVGREARGLDHVFAAGLMFVEALDEGGGCTFGVSANS